MGLTILLSVQNGTFYFCQQVNMLLQRVPALSAIWALEKSVLHEIRVSRTDLGHLLAQKTPNLHIHMPKIMVVETVLVIFVLVGDPLYFQEDGFKRKQFYNFFYTIF